MGDNYDFIDTASDFNDDDTDDVSSDSSTNESSDTDTSDNFTDVGVESSDDSIEINDSDGFAYELESMFEGFDHFDFDDEAPKPHTDVVIESDDTDFESETEDVIEDIVVIELVVSTMEAYEDEDYEVEEIELLANEESESENDEKAAFHSLHNDLTNPDLFIENEEGDYTYDENEHGKQSYGNLSDEIGERNLTAQRELDSKLETDDAGHLIATRFSGSGDNENLEPMDRNLNRGSFKRRENSWADSLENGDKVFVNIESYHSENNDHPEAFMGYTITEHQDGTREWDAFSYQNESNSVQVAQNEEVYEQNDLMDEYANPIDYNPDDFEDELSS